MFGDPKNGLFGDKGTLFDFKNSKNNINSNTNNNNTKDKNSELKMINKSNEENKLLFKDKNALYKVGESNARLFGPINNYNNNDKTLFNSINKKQNIFSNSFTDNLPGNNKKDSLLLSVNNNINIFNKEKCQICSLNKFTIYPSFKNSLIYIREFSNCNNNEKKIKVYKFESNSLDISSNLEKTIINHLEDNFNLTENNYYEKQFHKIIKINCQINEPEKYSFIVEINEKDSIY